MKGLFDQPAKQSSLPQKLTTEGFVSCCGIDTLDWFPSYLGRDPVGTRRMIQKDLDYHKEWSFNSMMIVSLNGVQKKLWHKTLLRNGFKVCVDRVDHGARNWLTLYYWRKDKKNRLGTVRARNTRRRGR